MPRKLSYPASPSQFKRQCENGFRRVNDAPDATFVWKFGPKRCTFPTGITGFSGWGTVSAPGFKSKTFVASATRETGVEMK